MMLRFFGPVFAVVLFFHGSVLFFSLHTAPPVPQEVRAVVAFFVSPVAVQRSSSLRAVPPRPEPDPPRAPAPQVRTANPLPPTVVPAVSETSSQQEIPTDSVASGLPATSSMPSTLAPAPSEPSVAPPLSVSIEAVRYLRPPQVVYPPLSRRLGEAGRVVMRVLVDTQGVPVEVVVTEPSAFARLNDQAVQAMRQARFEPYRVNGRPMAVTVLTPIVFKLEDRP